MLNATHRAAVLATAIVTVLATHLGLPTQPGERRGALAQNASPVADLALVLAIDCSFSVSAAEFELQVQGTARAFADPEVIEAITSGPAGYIQVAVIQWSTEDSQVLAVPWTRVGSVDEALALAARISVQPRQTAEGATSISGAIAAGLEVLAQAPVPAARYVIDISGDGTNNRGEPVDHARDRAIRAGVTINGLTILNEVKWLHHYFRNHVIGGPGSFVEIADHYEAYAAAIKRKLLREIRGVWVSRAAPHTADS